MSDFEAILNIYKRKLIAAGLGIAVLAPFVLSGGDKEPAPVTAQSRDGLIKADLAAREKQAERAAWSAQHGD